MGLTIKVLLHLINYHLSSETENPETSTQQTVFILNLAPTTLSKQNGNSN